MDGHSNLAGQAGHGNDFSGSEERQVEFGRCGVCGGLAVELFRFPKDAGRGPIFCLPCARDRRGSSATTLNDLAEEFRALRRVLESYKESDFGS